MSWNLLIFSIDFVFLDFTVGLWNNIHEWCKIEIEIIIILIFIKNSIIIGVTDVKEGKFNDKILVKEIIKLTWIYGCMNIDSRYSESQQINPNKNLTLWSEWQKPKTILKARFKKVIYKGTTIKLIIDVSSENLWYEKKLAFSYIFFSYLWYEKKSMIWAMIWEKTNL